MGSEARVGVQQYYGLCRIVRKGNWAQRRIYRARLMLGFVGAVPKISNLGRRKRERVTKILDWNESDLDDETRLGLDPPLRRVTGCVD
ncbi:hypothetical protein MTR_8g466650 [Medicago truncatula]|uniref:Uncharacterized protein n=1 Tax=Medicago truncatula TaxID=3880 RepID=A0A072U1L6_MEDTR|nr:hypothetical protein MTR_8g466650 [Medicago truncatula]